VMKLGIYYIGCLDTGVIYVGQSEDIDARFAGHRYFLRLGQHHNKRLQRAWDRHGEERFEFRLVIEVFDIEELDGAEQDEMDRLRGIGVKLFNVCPVAGTCRGVKRSDEFRRRIGDFHRGRKRSDEARKRMSEVQAQRGRELSDEVRVRLAEASRKNHLGSKHSDETKVRMSAAQRLRYTRNNCRLRDREGNIHDVIHLSEFCDKYGLTLTCVCGVLNGRVKSHRGWTDGNRSVEELGVIRYIPKREKR